MSHSESLSERHEREVSEILPHGVQIFASGRLNENRDTKVDRVKGTEYWRFRNELKCTQKKSYSFKVAEWNELVQDVYSQSAEERPGWFVRFYGEGKDVKRTPVIQDLVVLSAHDFCELLEELVTLRNGDTEAR